MENFFNPRTKKKKKTQEIKDGRATVSLFIDVASLVVALHILEFLWHTEALMVIRLSHRARAHIKQTRLHYCE